MARIADDDNLRKKLLEMVGIDTDKFIDEKKSKIKSPFFRYKTVESDKLVDLDHKESCQSQAL